MNLSSLHCPKCRTPLTALQSFNQAELTPCPYCGAPLQVEIFPAFFRPVATGRDGEALMVEGESSCFYHPQKKAVLPCDACGRFLCALCDCELHGQHFCPACLEIGGRKKRIESVENVRVLYARQAFMLSLLPFLITGLAAIFVFLRYRKEPGSLVQPMRWAFPTALVLGILQVLAYTSLILLIVFR